MLNWNGYQDTIECLDSLSQTTYEDFFIVVGDNGSTNDSLCHIRNHCREKGYSLYNEIVPGAKKAEQRAIYVCDLKTNTGFAVGNNAVAKKICNSYEYILLLNNDTEVPAGTIESMLKTAKDKKTVALTCDIRSYYRRNELWNAGGYFTILGERKYFSQKKIDGLKFIVKSKFILNS